MKSSATSVFCCIYSFNFLCFASFLFDFFSPFMLCCCGYFYSPSVCMCVLSCDHLMHHSLLPLSSTKPSAKPIVPRSPQLFALSLHFTSYFSPAFPWCRSNPLAANRKPECHRHVSERQLCVRRRDMWLRQPLSYSTILPFNRISVQQVRHCPAPRGCPGPLSVCGQHPEGSKVRKYKTFFSWI